MTITKAAHIKDYLDEYVIGQEEAKRVVSSTAFMYYMRYRIKGMGRDVSMFPKPNLLILGPTGCGKTYIMDTLANLIDVEFITAPAPAITPEGYVGDSLRDILAQKAKELMHEFDNNADIVLARMQNCILFIDEIDKLGHHAGSSGGDFNRTIQHGILKIIEGSEVSLDLSVSKSIERLITINTKDMFIVCAGHFESIEQSRKESKSTMGFKETEVAELSIHEEITKAGIIRELAGRFPIVAELGQLSTDEIMKVMEAKSSTYRKYRALFKLFGKKIGLTNSDLGTIIETVKDNKIGMRAMDGAIYSVIKDKIWELDLEEAAEIQNECRIKNGP